MKGLARASCASSITAIGVASCCILPMTMMLLGLGGSWLAVFGKIAAVSYYVLAFAVFLLVLTWIVSFKRGSIGKFAWWLIPSTALSIVSWVIVLNEARINDFLIGMM
ncbi:MAG: hypothetical protein K5905_11365 [Roseibium sp.]|uniref:hypothetical protein n=1 Tax=Roseibium sp. TaxID=1936156 RepID=UPI0026153D4E|nr:hypothetical protein [Roseibium sp.]MCV0426063.1 hypothetical protein [Roseibium sp.]